MLRVRRYRSGRFREYCPSAHLKACTRIFWKLEPAGTFARQHLEILQRNNWSHISQEVLVSTPRRFGKTISVSVACLLIPSHIYTHHTTHSTFFLFIFC
jgi:hypothetical protein